MKAVAILTLVAAGCAGLADHGAQDDGGTSDAPMGCRITISTDPTDPVAGPATTVRATANDDQVGGVPTRTWTVSFGTTNPTPVPFTVVPASDGKQIDFTTDVAGSYHITLDVEPVVSCDQAQPVDVTAHDPHANVTDYRLRITPLPTSVVPAQDKHIQVFGGANTTLSQVSLDHGIASSGNVTTSSGAGVPAFVQFYSVGTRLPLIETFADAAGAWSANLLGPYDVVVLPLIGSEPGQRFVAWNPSTPLHMAAPSVISGTVHDPLGNPLANATVEFVIDGVPSSVGTTIADGSFTALGFPSAGVPVGVLVTPPSGSPLPKLQGSSMAWNLGASLAINYAASFATQASVAGIHVRRGGVAAPNAKVVIAGTLATGGTVAGITVQAVVRVAVTTNGAGDIPAGTTAPKNVLSLVADVSSALGLGALDLTGTPPTTVDTSAPISAPGTVRDHNSSPLDHVSVDATPIGSLASAGGAVVHATTAANGSYSLSLASGGHYTLRVRDPAGRGAPLDLADVTSATLPAASTLASSLTISGFATSQGQPVTNASVQILCALCTGIDATRPFGEGSTDSTGGFTVSVADPGTM